jgi:hypothetical protein
MNRALHTASWAWFAVVMYRRRPMWPWIRLPGLGNVGFTVAFLLFAWSIVPPSRGRLPVGRDLIFIYVSCHDIYI